MNALPARLRASRGSIALAAVCLALAACTQAPQPAAVSPVPEPVIAAPAATTQPLVRAARAQVGVTRFYDPAYVQLSYPGGDVPSDRGVCTDVVIRALRAQGIDLQRRIHEDRRAHPAAYPARWRNQAADRNIDHRRVPNQMAWFARQHWTRAIDTGASGYHAGDIVAWDLGAGVLHIGIVSDRSSADGVPLILHNIGHGTREENLLFGYRIIGHYRPGSAADAEVARR